MTALTPAQLTDIIFAKAEGTSRMIVGIAGPAGSGKSTLANELAKGLDLPTAVVPMDGFHMNNDALVARDLLARKGAPQTFLASAFVDLVRDLRSGAHVSYPTFDRDADCTVPNGGTVDAATRIVLVEGNSLRLDTPPWSDLTTLFDLTISLEVPRAELLARLIDRWRTHGLSEADATARATSNDMRNVDFVTQNARPADYVLHTT